MENTKPAISFYTIILFSSVFTPTYGHSWLAKADTWVIHHIRIRDDPSHKNQGPTGSFQKQESTKLCFSIASDDIHCYNGTVYAPMSQVLESN
jgi:hypothetical protein